MKKLLLLLVLSSFSILTKAQVNLYFKVRDLVQITHPEINLDGKLISVNIWSVDNQESREANKGFDKAYKVYESAKLKGGLKGLVSIAVNVDNLSSVATISYRKDNVTKLISCKLEDLDDFKSAGFSNVVYDSKGFIVFKDLKSADVFQSINSLITR